MVSVYFIQKTKMVNIDGKRIELQLVSHYIIVHAVMVLWPGHSFLNVLATCSAHCILHVHV